MSTGQYRSRGWLEYNIDMMNVHYLACSSQNVRGYLMVPGTYVTKCYTNFPGVGLFLTTHRPTNISLTLFNL